MYEAMRQRAPNSSQIAGAATSVLVTMLVGYGLANGLGKHIVEAFDPPVVLAVLPDIIDEPEPFEPLNLDTSIDLPMLEFDWIPPEIVGEPSPIIVERKQVAEARIGPAVIGPSTPVRVAPRLKTRDEPPYPAIEVRNGNEGITGIEVCVDARGRVTSASLKQSSGHARLDEAALKWVRGARFTPGTIDGAPQSMCGHSVFYEWKIENSRA